MSELAPRLAVPRRRRWALDAAAALGVMSMAAVVGAHLLGVRPLIVAGSSMEPALPLGALAVAVDTPVGHLEVGDVVSVVRDDGARVTHRLVDVDPVAVPGQRSGDDGPAVLTLQGDANPGPDATRPVEASVDKVVWTVPELGAVIRWTRSPATAFVFGAFAGVALWSAGRRRARPIRAVLWIDDVPYQVLP